VAFGTLVPVYTRGALMKMSPNARVVALSLGIEQAELSGLAEGLATSVGGAYTGPATPTPSHDLSTQAVPRAELLD